jgi:hypothetical protein
MLSTWSARIDMNVDATNVEKERSQNQIHTAKIGRREERAHKMIQIFFENDANDIAADCIDGVRYTGWREGSYWSAKRAATRRLIAHIYEKQTGKSESEMPHEEDGLLHPGTMGKIVQILRANGFDSQADEIEAAMEEACRVWDAMDRRDSRLPHG